MEKNIHGQDTGKNFANAFNAAEPLLFTPKAMDALEKSIALLEQDVDAFRIGTMNYYRFLCNVGIENILLRLSILRNTGVMIVGLQLKKFDRYVARARDYLEQCYASACRAHNLLWALYDLSAYNGCTGAELDNLAKDALLYIHDFVALLAQVVNNFSFAYQFPKRIVPEMLDASSMTIFIDGYGFQACIRTGVDQEEAWRKRLASDCRVAKDRYSQIVHRLSAGCA